MGDQDWKGEQNKISILQLLNLHQQMAYATMPIIKTKARSPEEMATTPKDFIKLNFDKASKGNSGKAGLGGIFKDNNGNIILPLCREHGY
jgi:hypothetical protein